LALGWVADAKAATDASPDAEAYDHRRSGDSCRWDECGEDGQSEVQQFEQHTGAKVEDLCEEQHDSAMADHGVDGQEPTDQEVALVEPAEDQNHTV
jgi:hypothetical protein